MKISERERERDIIRHFTIKLVMDNICEAAVVGQRFIKDSSFYKSYFICHFFNKLWESLPPSHLFLIKRSVCTIRFSEKFNIQPF